MHSVLVTNIFICRGAFVMERSSISSFSEGHKLERHSRTFPGLPLCDQILGHYAFREHMFFRKIALVIGKVM
jgi:hypothetical protein